MNASIRKLPLRSDTLAFMLALKSPPVYLESINKLVPGWGRALVSAEHVSKLDLFCLYAAAVTVGNGCRISEVLSIKSGQIQPNGTAFIKPSKGSSSRLIYLGITPEQAEQYAQLPLKSAVFPLTYIQVWRACVKYGFADRIPNHQHLAVTHAGRYRLAQAVAKNAGAVAAGEVLGHKSENSILYYIDPQGCKQIVSKKQAKNNPQRLYKILDLEIEKQLKKHAHG